MIWYGSFIYLCHSKYDRNIILSRFFSWYYRAYKPILEVEIDDIVMVTQNRNFFESLTQELDTLFDYTFQEEPKLKLLNSIIIQSEHCIIIYQTDPT